MFSVINTADTILSLIESARINERAQQVIYYTATACAVIIAIASYLSTATQLWWLDHGDEVIAKSKKFLNTFAAVCLGLYQTGVELRPVANRLTATIADRAYYLAADF